METRVLIRSRDNPILSRERDKLWRFLARSDYKFSINDYFKGALINNKYDEDGLPFIDTGFRLELPLDSDQESFLRLTFPNIKLHY